MKICITGSTGFVGKNLTYFLEAKGFEIYPLNLRKENWIDDFPNHVDAVIHLAGKAHDTENTIEKEEYFKVNVEYTKTLFTLFLNSDVKNFIFFSSVKAVADSVNGILDENHICTPLTYYGQSKLDAEKYILSQEIPSNKKIFILRPCMIHGPGNKGNLNLLYKIVSKGIPWPLASFHNERSFLCIDNLNYVISSLLTKDINGGIYNLADDNSVSTNDLITLIANVTAKKSIFCRIPKKIIYYTAKIGDLLGLPLNSERLKKLTENYVVSNEKIKRELEIENFPVSSKDGLIKTIESFNK